MAMRCPRCSIEMTRRTDNNKELYICTNCRTVCYTSDVHERNRTKFNDTVILQIDGGIITGLLVFLTLTSLIPIVSTPFNNIIVILLTAGVIFPFAVSAIIVLCGHIKESGLQRTIRISKLIKKAKDLLGVRISYGCNSSLACS